MPLGPWAIAKRSLRIQIVFSNPLLYYLLDGVMDKALTVKAEGPGIKTQLSIYIIKEDFALFSSKLPDF